MRADSGFYTHAVCRKTKVRFSITIRQRASLRNLIAEKSLQAQVMELAMAGELSTLSKVNDRRHWGGKQESSRT